jgi:hypothetical protein
LFICFLISTVLSHFVLLILHFGWGLHNAGMQSFLCYFRSCFQEEYGWPAFLTGALHSLIRLLTARPRRDCVVIPPKRPREPRYSSSQQKVFSSSTSQVVGWSIIRTTLSWPMQPMSGCIVEDLFIHSIPVTPGCLTLSLLKSRGKHSGNCCYQLPVPCAVSPRQLEAEHWQGIILLSPRGFRSSS